MASKLWGRGDPRDVGGGLPDRIQSQYAYRRLRAFRHLAPTSVEEDVPEDGLQKPTYQ